MSAHPPMTDNRASGETPDLPRLETIGVIGAGVMGVGLVAIVGAVRVAHSVD